MPVTLVLIAYWLYVVTRCSISGVLRPVYCQMTVTTGMSISGKMHLCQAKETPGSAHIISHTSIRRRLIADRCERAPTPCAHYARLGALVASSHDTMLAIVSR